SWPRARRLTVPLRSPSAGSSLLTSACYGDSARFDFRSTRFSWSYSSEIRLSSQAQSWQRNCLEEKEIRRNISRNIPERKFTSSGACETVLSPRRPSHLLPSCKHFRGRAACGGVPNSSTELQASQGVRMKRHKEEADIPL